ncbi:uncharacterized protein BDR25DRAFT_241235 [Lindgomyces ingoldianus]|uniref:Uncharacterized protein n=1 Tax=Lindgomyces ingoldianus TaxID=673940 RepID=A0ACB6QD43_9PLEO|nr:uncharacterized protein BDR25DRAFT_241235 [Lindgomyces ingoldianus]KAF2464836.1 hypothetical protein BDR25DRAFT_241235 [Lindgomyces ingoldianus]
MPSLLATRDPVGDVKDTFSSWDKCMAKTYCKWPVIVGIVVGSLIILSIVFCVARCICCGAECACCCLRCCSCCTPSSRRSGHKRMNSAAPPAYPPSYPAAPPSDTRPVNQQYRSHAAPSFAPAPPPPPLPAPAPAPAPASAPLHKVAPEPERPQYARFDSSKPVNEDALPAMPSWNEARSVHVEETVMPEKKGDMEMDRLNQNGSVIDSTVTAAAAVGGPRRSPARSPVQRSPTQDSYGFPPGYQANSLAGGPPHRSPQSSPLPYGRQYGEHQDNYRGGSPAQSLSPVYVAGGGYAQNQSYGHRSPNQNNNQPYDRPNARPSPPNNGGGVGQGYGYSVNSREIVEMPSPGLHRNDTFGLPPSAKSNSPGYALASTRSEPPAAYPGQQTYEAAEPSYPGQQSYQAYQPASEPQYSGLARKPVDGSWKEV